MPITAAKRLLSSSLLAYSCVTALIATVFAQTPRAQTPSSLPTATAPAQTSSSTIIFCVEQSDTESDALTRVNQLLGMEQIHVVATSACDRNTDENNTIYITFEAEPAHNRVDIVAQKNNAFFFRRPISNLSAADAPISRLAAEDRLSELIILIQSILIESNGSDAKVTPPAQPTSSTKTSSVTSQTSIQKTLLPPSSTQFSLAAHIAGRIRSSQPSTVDLGIELAWHRLFARGLYSFPSSHIQDNVPIQQWGLAWNLGYRHPLWIRNA